MQQAYKTEVVISASAKLVESIADWLTERELGRRHCFVISFDVLGRYQWLKWLYDSQGLRIWEEETGIES